MNTAVRAGPACVDWSSPDTFSPAAAPHVRQQSRPGVLQPPPDFAEQILAQLGARRGHLDGLVPEDLFAYDQDHYGGLPVVDVLAERAPIGSGSQVADF